MRLDANRLCCSITKRARRHLGEIFEYIAKDSPQNASGMIVRILDAIDSLDQFPHRFGVPRGKISNDKHVRAMSVRPYIVVYLIEESKHRVVVMRVTHGARRIK